MPDYKADSVDSYEDDDDDDVFNSVTANNRQAFLTLKPHLFTPPWRSDADCQYNRFSGDWNNFVEIVNWSLNMQLNVPG